MSKWDVLVKRLMGEAEIHNARRTLPRQIPSEQVEWAAYNHGMAVAYHECAFLVDQTVSIPAPKPSEWHRVEDELPVHHRPVLVKYISSDEDYDITFYNDMGHWNTLVKSTVTHWRELPKPPKKERTK
jgi:hypothetical protein